MIVAPFTSKSVRSLAGVVVLGVIFLAMPGCGGGPTPVPIPKYTPTQMASEAIAQYDTNKDRLLDAQELKACPSLGESSSAIDKNGDKKLDHDELVERFQAYGQAGIGVIDTRLKVMRGSQPVKNALVKMIPEKFMGSSIKPAQGTTRDDGEAVFLTEGVEHQGLNYGCFRVEITSGSGEAIPAKFNTNTVLGKEIFGRIRGGWILDLNR